MSFESLQEPYIPGQVADLEIAMETVRLMYYFICYTQHLIVWQGICAGYQYHINADIALAHWQYYLHTNDIEWLREKAWPIIFDAAEMFVDFVQFSLNYSQGTIWTFAITDPVRHPNDLSDIDSNELG